MHTQFMHAVDMQQHTRIVSKHVVIVHARLDQSDSKTATVQCKLCYMSQKLKHCQVPAAVTDFSSATVQFIDEQCKRQPQTWKFALSAIQATQSQSSKSPLSC